MKRFSFFCVAIASCFASLTIFAQDHPQPVQATDESRDTQIEGEFRGYLNGVSVLKLLKNSVINSDGSRTLHAGSQSAEANELNEKFCQRMGAKDVTNEASILLGPGAIYGGVCAGTGVQLNAPTIQAVPGSQSGKVYLPSTTIGVDLISPFSNVQNAQIQIVPSAINGSAPIGVQYYVNAATNFYNLPSVNIGSATIKVFETLAPCTISVERMVGPGNAYLSPFVVCTPAKSSATTTNNGCYARATCVNAQGLITNF